MAPTFPITPATTAFVGALSGEALIRARTGPGPDGARHAGWPLPGLIEPPPPLTHPRHHLCDRVGVGTRLTELAHRVLIGDVSDVADSGCCASGG